MVNTVWIIAVNGRDFHPLADHMTNLRNFTNEDIIFSISIFTSVNA